MSSVLLHHLENHAMSFIDESLRDVRAHAGPSLSQVPDSELRVAMYTLVLRVCDLMRSGAPEKASAPETARELYLRQTRDIMEWVDARSVYTVGHTAKVVRHVVQMAARMGLPDTAIHDLEDAAWLHNLGLLVQIGSASLADVDRRLSSEEIKRARNHTLIGAEMIRPLPFVSHLVSVVRYHHHPYGGENPGDPRGDALPLGSRLIAVADAYAAMLEPRAYRPALTRRQALDELVKASGSHFDPQLVPLAHELA